MYSWAQLWDGLDYSGRRLCGCEPHKEDEAGVKNGPLIHRGLGLNTYSFLPGKRTHIPSFFSHFRFLKTFLYSFSFLLSYCLSYVFNSVSILHLVVQSMISLHLINS